MTNKQIQNLLAYLGYYAGEIDGILGTQSVAAIKTFQTAEGLDADGIAGEITQSMLVDAVADNRFAASTESKTETAASSSASSESGDWWDDIQYFKRSEFECHCGGKYCDGFPAEPAEALVRVADRVREHFGAPAMVSSGVRCEKHNAAVGGVANSRHLLGHAMDFCVAGHTAAEVLAYAQAQPEIVYAYAINDNYVHMDIGG